MASAIAIHNLEKQLGLFKLGPITLNVPRGAIYGLIGPNGAGKSTTLDLLMGMGHLDSGSVNILGLDVSTNEVAIKRRIAYVSPELNYQSWGTVGRAIKFVSGFYPDWDHKRCDRLQFSFGLHAEEKVVALSFGARIKLALVMALSRDAELLLLDEPTVGLDAVARRQLFSELLAFMQKEDRTILISSHQLSDLERFADHVAIINDGRLVSAGRMDELIERYSLLHVQSLSEDLLRLPGSRIVMRDGDHVHLLIDRTLTQHESLKSMGVEIIAELPLTLEELFLSLVGTTRVIQANAA